MRSYPDVQPITPVLAPDLEIAVPGSKSLTNRALMVAALAEGDSRLEGALRADDSEVMCRALRTLGIPVAVHGAHFHVSGRGGRVPATEADLDLRLSGTSIRFLTALVALGEGRYRLDGNARMRERPIEHLLEALRPLGAEVATEFDNGCPPLRVAASGLEGGATRVRGDASSQYLSALLMAAPYARAPVTVTVEGELQSKPFVDMTLALMRDFGVEVERDGYESFSVAPGRYRGRHYAVEGDAMAAGYFWAAAAVTGGRVRTTNVGSASVQGDRRLAEVLAAMGCRVRWGETWCEVRAPRGALAGGRFDLNDMPDQAQTLAVVALFAAAPVRIDNVWNLRIKETDRLAALARELGKFGARVEEGRDFLVVHPPAASAVPPRIEVDTYGDHRMAMAFALAGLRLPGVEIRDPGCVAKTYPGFFDDLARLAPSATGRTPTDP